MDTTPDLPGIQPKPKPAKRRGQADFELIAAGRLPAADSLDIQGRPTWRLDSLLAWLSVPRGDFIGMLPTRSDGWKQRGGPDLYKSTAP